MWVLFFPKAPSRPFRRELGAIWRLSGRDFAARSCEYAQRQRRGASRFGKTPGSAGLTALALVGRELQRQESPDSLRPHSTCHSDSSSHALSRRYAVRREILACVMQCRTPIERIPVKTSAERTNSGVTISPRPFISEARYYEAPKWFVNRGSL